MNRQQRNQIRAEREFRQEQAKTHDELWGESLFRSLPKNQDGTVSVSNASIRPIDDLNDLMIPLNTRTTRK